MNVDKVKFELGQTVYFKMDPEMSGIVTEIIFNANGVIYGISWADFEDRRHYEVELTAEKTFTQEKT